MLGRLKNMFNCCTSAPQLDQEQIEAEKLEKQRKIDLLKQNNMSLTDEEEQFHKSIADDNRKLIIGANTEEKINTTGGFRNGLEIDRKLINEEERNEEGLIFTEEGIAKYMDLWDAMEGFEILYEKGNLIIHCKRTGSNFNKNIYVGKCQYKMAKADFANKITLQQIRDIVNFLF